MFNRYPIHELIENRREELRVRRSELALRCGYKNISKGLRRIGSVCEGDFYSEASKKVLDALPAALEVENAVVKAAISDTANIIAEAERRAAAARETVYRASFRPHGYLLGTDTRPYQIVISGITGGAERWHKIPFDLSQPPVTFAAQAHAVVRKNRVFVRKRNISNAGFDGSQARCRKLGYPTS
jgi:hypothetical protein